MLRGLCEAFRRTCGAFRDRRGAFSEPREQAICQDECVRNKYPDGILWTTIGEEVSESGRLSRLRDLIRWWTEADIADLGSGDWTDSANP